MTPSTEPIGSLTAIWRYPVKSMAGEALQAVELDERGLVGDRAWAVYGADGRLASGKTTQRFRRMDAVFTLAAQTAAGSAEGEAVVVLASDATWLMAGESGTDSALADIFGEPVALRLESLGAGPSQLLGGHLDAGSVSIVGTATLVALGELLGGAPVDPRAVRTNLVVSTDEPYVEETWLGREIRTGAARLRVIEQIERCRMIDLDHVGLPGRPGLLKAVASHRDLCAGVYAEIVAVGRLEVGASLRMTARPD